MELKPALFDIPSDDPFRNDVLERKPLAESLTSLALSVTPPFVIAIDAPWGRGKTTFLRMWNVLLEKSDATSLYFNAWETDFAADPLVAFVSELEVVIDQKRTDPETAKRVRYLKKIGGSILKRAIPAAAKLATAGLLDAEKIVEEATASLAEKVAEDAVEAYESNKKLISEFHSKLKELVDHLSVAPGSAPRLLILVDELDRCRPSYALEMLERMKHVLNVSNVVFVLAIDKQQLLTSIESAYGARTDSIEYLRRFVDLEFELPGPSTPRAFTDYLFGQFRFDEVFRKRTHPDLQYDLEHFKATFNELSSLLDLSLRAREQCFTRLRVALLATPDDHYLYPDVLVTLAILYTVARPVYLRFVENAGSVGELLKFLCDRRGGDEYLYSHHGMLLEAMLISAKRGTGGQDVPEWQQHLRIATAAEGPKTYQDQRQKKRSQDITNFVHEIERRRGQIPNLGEIRKRVEIGPLT